MKTSGVSIAVLLFFLTISSVNAQSPVDKTRNCNFEFTLRLKVNGEIKEYNMTGVEEIKITPVGNYTRIVTCRLADNEIMELANPFLFLTGSARGDFNGDGVEEVIYDSFSVLTKSGNLKLVYHYKGD